MHKPESILENEPLKFSGAEMQTDVLMSPNLKMDHGGSTANRPDN